MQTLWFIFRHLDQFRLPFFGNLLVAFLDGLVVFLIPVLLSEFTKGDLSVESFWRLLPFLVGCFLASLVLQWIIRRSGEALARQFGNHLRLKYFQQIEQLPGALLLEHHSGNLLSLVTRACDGAAQVVFAAVWLFAHSLATLSLFFFFTARESLFIALLNGCILILFLLVSVFFSRRMVPIAARLNLLHAVLIERFVDLMTNIFTVKKLGISRFTTSQVSEAVEQNYRQIDRLQRFHADRWFVLHAIFGIAFLTTIGFLLSQISQGENSPAVLILFISAFAVVRSQVERLSELIKDLLEVNAYIETLETITGREQRQEERGSECPLQWNALELQEVTFSYRGRGATLNVPHFSLSPGEVISIRGESGEGKSTFLNILCNFLEPQRGERLLDRRPYAEFPRNRLESLFGMVSQEMELFHLSVRENLSLGRPHKDEQIRTILRGLLLEEWLEQLPEGLDTLVGEKGVKLSAGQKQRVNIARGLLLERPILLFDEPTSHLDKETEQGVVDFLRGQLKGRSAVIVTHRSAVETLCDRGYVVREGTLIEE
ncbi:ABC transporter ATP-binding protein/permease [bacterium]|nr:ABC transporter ATP-binding protein/permease [bacterium]